MINGNIITAFSLALISMPGIAQDFQRRAQMIGGEPGRGRCSAEVMVDGAAEIDLRADGANIRTLEGQPAVWRAFECTTPIPPNPLEFRFAPVQGRGRQALVRPPQNGAPAVVRIDDPQSGAGVYRFDLLWRGGGDDRPLDRDRDRGGDRDRAPFVSDDAIRMCQDSVRRQAGERFHTDRIEFRRIGMDDAPDRREWVTGVIEIRREDDRRDPFRFSCSVDFRERAIRSVQIDPMDRDRDRR